MDTYRIGSGDLVVSWSVFDNKYQAVLLDGDGVSVSLSAITGRGRTSISKNNYSVSGNSVVWTFPAESQLITGNYTLEMTITDSTGDRKVDYDRAFRLSVDGKNIGSEACYIASYVTETDTDETVDMIGLINEAISDASDTVDGLVEQTNAAIEEMEAEANEAVSAAEQAASDARTAISDLTEATEGALAVLGYAAVSESTFASMESLDAVPANTLFFVYEDEEEETDDTTESTD